MCSLSWGLVLYGAVSGRGCSPSLRSSSWCLPRISEWEVGVDFGGRQCVAETFMQRRLREVLPVFMLEDNFSELVEVMEILGVMCYWENGIKKTYSPTQRTDEWYWDCNRRYLLLFACNLPESQTSRWSIMGRSHDGASPLSFLMISQSGLFWSGTERSFLVIKLYCRAVGSYLLSPDFLLWFLFTIA